MSAAPAEAVVSTDVVRARATRALPRPAAVYFAVVAAVAAAATLPFLGRLEFGTSGSSWVTFGVFAGCAAIAQLFVVKTPRNQAYYTTAAFLIPAALLLPPQLVALVGLAAHVPEWLKYRYAWYIQSFNICNYSIGAMAAWATARGLVAFTHTGADYGLRLAVTGMAAAVVFVALNHLLLAPMLHYARGHSYRETGLFEFENLASDLVLASLGVGVAGLWHYAPALIPFTMMPLFLIHRSLAVPQLEEEARVDAKTGLFNARHFGEALAAEFARSARSGRSLSVVMADLDLLRDVNNTYGHLAGDIVLKSVADVFLDGLREYDLAARFGGEEFSILLPGTGREEAMEIADRLRAAVAAAGIRVSGSSEPIRATVSVGVATFPEDAGDPNQLIHQADLAVYRAKVQGRNRVLAAGAPSFAVQEVPRSASREVTEVAAPGPTRPRRGLGGAARLPRERREPRFIALTARVNTVVAVTSAAGIAAGAAAFLGRPRIDVLGLFALAALAGIGQALALEADEGSISVSAVAALAGAALFHPYAALPVAATMAAVDWSVRRPPVQRVLFNVGMISLASVAAAGIFSVAERGHSKLLLAAAGLLAGTVYFLVNTFVLGLALASEAREHVWPLWRERFVWLFRHYVVYGFIGAVIAIAYSAAGLYALAVFAVPLLLMRQTQEAYLRHTKESSHKLRRAAETIQQQNESLELANRLLRERATSSMEALAATVDARDSYTAGHSRRVRDVALAIGVELGLSDVEQEVLGHAAQFHDIGKIALPDAILLKPGPLTGTEWDAMRRHPDEGARIIERIGFLDDAVPAIRHHHENYDGTGYPLGLKREDVPLGARIIHVADAFDSMMTTRIYRTAMGLDFALSELRNGAGGQFCPRCVDALERALPALGHQGLVMPGARLRLVSA